MRIVMNLEQARVQSESLHRFCQAQLQIYEQLQQSISVLGEDVLRQATERSSAGDFLLSVVVPLLKGATLLSELMTEANVAFLEEYIATVDECSLNSYELEQQIALWDIQIVESRLKLRQLADSSLELRNKAFQVSENTTLIGAYGEIRTELKNKLNQLLLFDRTSSMLFDEVFRVSLLLQQGFRLSARCWDDQTQKFIVPIDRELTWALELERCYDQRREWQNY